MQCLLGGRHHGKTRKSFFYILHRDFFLNTHRRRQADYNINVDNYNKHRNDEVGPPKVSWGVGKTLYLIRAY